MRLLSKLEIRQAMSKVTSMVKSVMKRENPYWSFRAILGLEKKYGFKSSFYFPVRKGYGIDCEVNEEIKKAIREIAQEKREICLHGSYESYNDAKRLRGEKETLEEILGRHVSGIRQHFLRFDVTRTWRIQEKTGLKYDATYGYADQIGFRASISFPFNPYDLINDKKSSILELPLTIMDKTLLARMELTLDEAWVHAKELLEIIKRNNGLAVILWHNTAFDKEDYPGWAEVYRRILEYLSKQDSWVVSSGAVARWWKHRNFLKIETKIEENTVKWNLTGNGWVKTYLPEGWKVTNRDENEVLTRVCGSMEILASKTE